MFNLSNFSFMKKITEFFEIFTVFHNETLTVPHSSADRVSGPLENAFQAVKNRMQSTLLFPLILFLKFRFRFGVGDGGFVNTQMGRLRHMKILIT